MVSVMMRVVLGASGASGGNIRPRYRMGSSGGRQERLHMLGKVGGLSNRPRVAGVTGGRSGKWLIGSSASRHRTPIGSAGGL